GETISRDDFFKIPADIFVPAAMENQVGEAAAESLQARVIAEGANGPLPPRGEANLVQRGVTVLPDVLANAGGVTISYYEWVQNRRSEQWHAADVEQRLESDMRAAYQRMLDFADRHKCGHRLAC